LDESLAVFNAILRIAEIESGARKSSFQDFDLSAELVKLAEVYEPSFDESGFEFTWSVESSKQLRGDRTLVAQSVANLLENALRHGASPVELRLEDVGARVELSVSDRGTGIPEADREQVLEPFFRRDESRTTPGSGLGLSLVRAVAELHDAELVLQDNGPGLVVKLIWS
jgi:signal transduction histidine kinase